MDNKNITGSIHSSMYHQLKKTGYATPVDVLMDIGVLSKEDCEAWRNGKVAYLEKVCNVNLKQLSAIMKEIRSYGTKNNLKASWTFYGKWKDKRKVKLQFSKSGNENIERAYATHYVSMDIKMSSSVK